ncbi:MAG: aldo/keto reductase [Pseudomonadota bacterium]|nr:MAG: aldo/keto reductase [Pseudomonadota bacterium]
MEYAHLGRTGLKVSRLCLGTMNFGPETSEADAFRIMDAALDHGINFFDTANVYGWKIGEGVTESIIGRWFAQGGGRREKVVLATKVYGEMGKWPNQSRLSAAHIRQACEDSLRRLQTDHIELYQMHHVDRGTPWEEIWQAMEVLVQQGKIVYVGSSNFAGWHIAQANEIARSRHFLGLVSEQSKYNLLTRHVELEVLPACERYGVGVIPWSPLAGGVLALSGRLGGATQSRRTGEFTRAARELHAERLERYGALCRELGEEPADVAIAWLLTRPAVCSPIIGPRTLEQLTTSLRALEIKLSPETLSALDSIFPGMKTAPEEYAW